MKKRTLIIATPLLCLTLITFGYHANSTSNEETVKTPALNVEVAKVKNESLDAISSLTGTLLPISETDVSFEIGGIVQTVYTEIGDTVKKGTALTTLKADDYQLQLKKADTAVLQAKASLSSADATIQSADARIKSAQANLNSVLKGARDQERTQAKNAVARAQDMYNKLEKDTNNMKSLYDEGIVSQKEYDDIQLQLANAKKDLNNAEQALAMIQEGATSEQIEQVQAGIQEAQAGKNQSKASQSQAIASYEQALISKEQAALTLSKTTLQSPLPGVILNKLISEGQQVNPGEPVFKIGQINQLKVLLPVPDRDIKEWTKGDQVTVTLYDNSKVGTVTKIYPQTNASTGTISVEVVIPNDNLAWVPGQIVKANRVTNDNKGILVPIEAVISNGLDPYVFKVVKGKAVKTSVTTGNLVNNKIHIIKGLKADEQIVIRGGELLLDGDPVKTNGSKKE